MLWQEEYTRQFLDSLLSKILVLLWNERSHQKRIIGPVCSRKIHDGEKVTREVKTDCKVKVETMTFWARLFLLLQFSVSQLFSFTSWLTFGLKEKMKDLSQWINISVPSAWDLAKPALRVTQEIFHYMRKVSANLLHRVKVRNEKKIGWIWMEIPVFSYTLKMKWQPTLLLFLKKSCQLFWKNFLYLKRDLDSSEIICVCAL